jgi:hypothetical protein
MRTSLLDRRLYYKGPMLLIRKDRAVRDEEKGVMMSIGRFLGLDPIFCENVKKS